MAQLAELLVRRRHLPRRRFGLTCSALWSKSRKPCGLARPSFQIWPQAPATTGEAIDRDDIRAHGKDEHIRQDSFYRAVDFYYRFLKAVTSE